MDKAIKLKTYSGCFRTYSCPQFVAKCFGSQQIKKNVPPHYIYRGSWAGMSVATVSSAQPVTTVSNTPPLLVTFPRCAKSQMFHQRRSAVCFSVCCVIPASTNRLWQLISPHAGRTLTGFRQGINRLWADYTDDRRWFSTSDRVAANYLSHQILPCEA